MMRRLGATCENISSDMTTIKKDSELTTGHARKTSCISSLGRWLKQYSHQPAAVRSGVMAIKWEAKRAAELKEKGYCARYRDSPEAHVGIE